MIGYGTIVKAKKDSKGTKHWLILHKANLDKMALVLRFGPQATLFFFVLKIRDTEDQIHTHFFARHTAAQGRQEFQEIEDIHPSSPNAQWEKSTQDYIAGVDGSTGRHSHEPSTYSIIPAPLPTSCVTGAMQCLPGG